MLTITKSQINSLNDAQFNNFKPRLWCHLAQFFPLQQFVTEEAWPAYFIAGIDLSRRCKMQTEYSITVLFNLLFTFELSPQAMARQPWMQEVLLQKPISESELTILLIKAAEKHLENEEVLRPYYS